MFRSFHLQFALFFSRIFVCKLFSYYICFGKNLTRYFSNDIRPNDAFLIILLSSLHTFQVANLVSFVKSKPGYVRLANLEGQGVKLVFKFRTAQPSGLLFYTATRDSSLALVLDDGSLLLRASPRGEISTG